MVIILEIKICSDREHVNLFQNNTEILLFRIKKLFHVSIFTNSK